MPTSKDLKDLDSQLKKTVISAESFKRGSSFDSSKSIANIHKTIGSLAGHTRKLAIRVISLEKTVENNSRKITSLKNLSQSQSERISGTNIGAKLPGSSTSSVEDNIAAITKSVSSIAEILSGRKKLAENTAAYERRKAEQDKRALAENNLEKRFEGLKKTAEGIIAPVKSILDRIIEFFVTVFLGRVVYKLLEWFGDPKNKQKVDSIIRFLGDHWPKLLALYLTFGTSLGRFALGLTRAVARGAVKLLAKIAMLAAAKKMRGARGVARFLGGGKGKLLANVVGTGVALGGAYALTQGLKGGGEEQSKAQGLRGGGYVRPRFPTFSGGGFNFKGMMGGASMGAMFGPLGMLLGGAFGGSNGFVSGEKGVDKVPAMLSDGEFVMSVGAVQKYGVDTLEAMNSSGGGTNQPKIVSGTTYAAGGGLIGDKPKQDEIKKQQQDAAKTPEAARAAKEAQSRKALSSGQGIKLKGATSGMSLGTGYAAKYKGKDSIVIKDGGKNFSTGIGDATINLGGIKYFAMKRGNDVIYVPQDSRDRGTGGLFQPGGLFGGPKNSARMDYAASKGKYYSSSDQKTYANYNDAMASKKSRMAKLASQQGLDRLSSQGGNLSAEQIAKMGAERKYYTGKGIRYDAESKAREKEYQNRGGWLGQLNRTWVKGWNRPDVKAADKASEARIKQAGAESIGRYYSSSDGKYYKDYATAKKARDLRLAQQQKKSTSNITPLPKPKPQSSYAQQMKTRQNARRSSGVSSKTPNFGATNPASSSAKAKTLGVKG